MLTLLLFAQSIALVVLIGRLLPGRNRRPPVWPVADHGSPRVSVLLPTFNEVKRVQPCLEGLMQQGPTVREILVIDGNSSDGTDHLVRGVTARDGRVRLTFEPPLPNGWVGKVWALQLGLEQTAGEWVMNVDADIEPEPGMIAAAVNAAEDLSLQVVSFSPRFAGQTAAEQWLQSALLVTLIYRAGAVGATGTAPADRTMANGQCFLARRDVLLAHGGYGIAQSSFSDDVTLARHLARRGVRVGFLDGSRLLSVRSYTSLGELWREWGRSIDLKDATPITQLTGDVGFLALVQGAPIVVLALWAFGVLQGGSAVLSAFIVVNALLLVIRASMLGALRASYDRSRWTYWLSPLADPLAVLRVVMSALTRPRRWRGREYAATTPSVT
ncbi:MAG: glycosyltransferase [Gemmatimonadaceae bacterium]